MGAFLRERRSCERFPIRMNVRCRLLRKRQEATSEASGCVVDISSTGILFGPGSRHPRGAAVALSIDWPVLYDEAFPIRLSVMGSVVRSDHRGTAVKILRHGFEPWRDDPLPTEAPRAGPMIREEPGHVDNTSTGSVV